LYFRRKREKIVEKPKKTHISTAKENAARMEENLDDERIFDPITGSYLTLEQAESGNWEVADELGIIPDAVIRDNFEPEAQEKQFILNHLFRKGYVRMDLTEEHVHIYDQLELLKPLEWSWSVFVQNPENGLAYTDIGIQKTNSSISSEARLIEIPLPFDAGQCVVKSKTSVTEFLLDAFNIAPDSTTEFDTIVYKQSTQQHYIDQIIEGFENDNRLIFEFYGKSLFVIIDCAPTYAEFVKIENTLGF